MTVPGLAIVSVSPSTSTLCPSSRSASVVHPALLLSPRYAELTSATSAGASAVVAGRMIKPIVMQRIVDAPDGASSRPPPAGDSRAARDPAAGRIVTIRSPYNPHLLASA